MKSKSTKSVGIPLTGSNIGIVTSGRLYGSNEKAIVFSNMDTNNQDDWLPVIEKISSNDFMILTYDYVQYEDEQSEVLKDVLSFVKASGAKKIILIGASRGGVASIKVAADFADNDSIAGVAALSAPMEYEGIVFYSDDELKGIKIPKLLVNSEFDDCAGDTRKMYELFNDPKKMIFYPGNDHGAELFGKQGESLVRELVFFIEYIFSGRF